ncbi:MULTISPECIES: aspartyl/asparaginyl beta-hydroxylase domain-containing protein [unclassified Streptomyces]|uniref:aspartyl/asparaginyl beta-hydroxylase domain-containing protein n=1 Tax=unclassified Streptomyces TaxID=2593676 RepID=UPI001652CEDF|nr:aspartyl/asparaginyl beta-hydroxylase domain-containing protein [Streptomyces sp. sk2.1]
MTKLFRELGDRILASLSGPVIQLQKRLNLWFRKTAGGNTRPVVFDIDETIPELRVLDRAFHEIRSEFLKAAENVAVMPTFHELDPLQRHISATTPHDWRMFYLYAMGEVAEKNAGLCPGTIAALKRVPNLFQASFSVLDPGKSVPAHEGPYYGYLRYHLAIEVPTDDPPCIRIRDVFHTWRAGGSLLFDDSWDHEVINTSAQRRVVLIVDVLRPMPGPQHMVNRFFTFVTRFFYGRPVMRRLAERTAAAA